LQISGANIILKKIDLKEKAGKMGIGGAKDSVKFIPTCNII
jgi:hypothetical protein